MSEMTIFKQGGAISNRARELTPLAKSLASTATMRRIQTNTNGTFKRIVNGEQIGKAVRGEINVVIVDLLPKVSRVYYEGAYDPNAKPTLPDCWSNLGDKPESAASNVQAPSCADCPQNIKGSGSNGSKACRYQRRIAVLLEGDASGEVYQFNVPAKSLFGKGDGNVHPFESYVRYLAANGISVDKVVTNISYDLNADSMELLFSPQRELNDDEYDLVTEVQANPETSRYTKLVVAQADGVTKKPEAAAKAEAKKPAVTRSADPDDEEADEPVAAPAKRKAEAPVADKKTSMADAMKSWGEDD